MRNSPNGVGRRAWATACTSRSCAKRYATSSATVMKVSPWRAANCSKSVCRAIEPSGFRISQITPAGYSPASRARSMLASVWPTRSEEHTSELQSQSNLVCRLLLEKKKKNKELFEYEFDAGMIDFDSLSPY